MTNLYRENKFYADKNFNQYSFKKYNAEYQYFSERFKAKYPGYKLDERLLVRPDTAKVINFEKLKSVLLSNNQQSLEENKWMFEGESKFLDGDSIKGGKIVFTAFPRAGNTFLRNYLEAITGVVTGGDMTSDLT
jgi:hypothetical protein